MTLGEWLVAARERLTAAGSDAPYLEAQILAAHAFLKDRAWVLAHPEAEVPLLAMELMLMRLEAKEPLAYVIGRREFYGLDFEVSPAVLVPRQETEVLVDAVLSFLGPTSNLSVLDVGTGSGCIAVALKHSRPGLSVSACDVSGDALNVAQRNAERHLAEIEFIEGDGIEAMGRGFDVVVSNPPYIGEDERVGPGVAEFEPHLALYSGPTGLEFYERLAGSLRTTLFVEVGDSQARAVRSLFEGAGHTVVESYRDLLGIERVLQISGH